MRIADKFHQKQYFFKFFVQIQRLLFLVPLPPSNLRLESFQSMILSMEGVFGTIHFTLREPGIQATWEGPNRGACDCYDVNIDPNDGKVARPALNERVIKTKRFFLAYFKLRITFYE